MEIIKKIKSQTDLTAEKFEYKFSFRSFGIGLVDSHC